MSPEDMLSSLHMLDVGLGAHKSMGRSSTVWLYHIPLDVDPLLLYWSCFLVN